MDDYIRFFQCFIWWFLGFDFNTDVIAKMTVITGVGGVVFLIGLFITFIFKKMAVSMMVKPSSKTTKENDYDK